MKKVEVSVSFALLLFFAFFFTPLFLLFSVLAAAVLHESGHLLLLSHFGVPLKKLRLSAFGAEIDAPNVERLSYGKELAVTLGGVGANVLGALFSAAIAVQCDLPYFFVLSGANAVLAAYNLLPVLPLDGGRALYLVTAYFFGPMVGDAVTAAVGLFVSLAIMLLGAHISLTMGEGYFFALAALFIFIGTIRQLALAKGAPKV